MLDFKLSDYVLDEGFIEKLKTAAEINRSSLVKTLLGDLASEQIDKKPLAEYLLNYIDNYDMDGLICAIKELNHD